MASLLFVARVDNLFSFHPRQEGIIINYRKLRSIMVLLPIREKHLCRAEVIRTVGCTASTQQAGASLEDDEHHECLQRWALGALCCRQAAEMGQSTGTPC